MGLASPHPALDQKSQKKQSKSKEGRRKGEGLHLLPPSFFYNTFQHVFHFIFSFSVSFSFLRESFISVIFQCNTV